MSRDKAEIRLFAVINGCLIESLGESTTPTYTRIHYLLKELKSFDGIDVDAIGFNQLPGKGWRSILYNNAVKTAVALRSAWRLIVNRPMVFFAYPHSLTTIQNRALFRLCELLKLKTILDIHDTIEQASAIGIEKFALNEHLEEHYFRNASLILALNMPMWKHIEGEYKLPQNKQVAFIPNAYERKFCQYYPDAYKSVENRFNICYIGGITKNRGIEILVEACEKLHQRYPNLKLYLYGSYSARFPSDLRERMESSDFIIRRVVLRRDIHESLLCMDLLVMPYNPKDNT
jgi:glycosyltransferase involved in cell wall biosynthesis